MEIKLKKLYDFEIFERWCNTPDSNSSRVDLYSVTSTRSDGVQGGEKFDTLTFRGLLDPETLNHTDVTPSDVASKAVIEAEMDNLE